jgi:N-methylhydantoinase A
MSYRIGVDIGGSFTDFAVFDEKTASISSLKVFSRPDKPGEEVLAGVRMAAERYGIPPDEIVYFTHGTTVGINTVIQRKGLRLALFVTDGFRDVLEIGRLKIPNMYNLLSKRPAPLISRDMVFGLPGRLDFEGGETRALDEAAVAEAARAAVSAGAEGIVVSLLHAYRYPRHELRVREVIEATVPDLPVVLSSETWPIIREYERTITAVIGGYVQPRVAHYLTSLQAALKEAGVRAEPHITKSNGGVMTAEQGKSNCVQMILSGTASGVIGAAHIAEIAGIERCLSLDIGGTSADVAVIERGRPQYGVGEQIGDFHIYIPSVSVSSIGDGGGSIAWVDGQNVLRVGPESAGSRPGPACYGRGGDQATITDAFVALGLIGHSDLAYNAVHIDAARAREVVGSLAAQINRTVEQTAESIIDIAVSGMYAEVSGLVSRFGIDPREFSILAFGGAGPMLACFLMRELRTREVLVPVAPGVLSALGGLIADLKNDFIRTVYVDLGPTSTELLTEAYAELCAAAKQWLHDHQGYAGRHEIIHSAEMRYRGQSFEIDTPFDPAVLTGDLSGLADAFHAEHRRLYDHADPGAPIQIISIRIVISGRTRKPEFPRQPLVEGAATPRGGIEIYLDGAHRTAALYDRAALLAGQSFAGPAVVTQEDCTTVVPPGFAVTVDERANLRIVMEDRS